MLACLPVVVCHPTGWEPQIQLEEGLVKTIAYFASLDLSRFKKPTKHTAHTNTDAELKSP